ncbi:carbohydrate kinase family protein [Actinophytocola gossypii]|uniref:Carbohydrate kinase family protein n=1 Tax=Actinophytocola gossypii TaxID=2812003 RepID=A0ABT2JI62_9PSEU|nr:carbohydrate kinase family protein [Actinophytocola gossypii]MCT2586929.1 carbohydrate kinase family protein [Actinophytocola gossypii]
MTAVAVAGVVNVRLAHAVEAFPVPFASGQHRPNGLSVRLSGTGWTGATTLRALGASVTFATYVGSDPLGILAMHGLRERGWYGPATQVCAEQPRSLVLYDRDGTRAGTTDLRSLPALRYPPELFGALLDEAGCEVALVNSTAFTRSLVEVAAGRGVPIATDLHLNTDVDNPHKRDWFSAATILACSHERLPDGPLAWVDGLWRRFATPVALVGCGSGGAVVAVRHDRSVWQVDAATPRGVRYTNGAGDTLLAVFVHRYHEIGDPVLAARYAVLGAGWKVGGHPDEEFGLSAAGLAALADTHGLPAVHRLR